MIRRLGHFTPVLLYLVVKAHPNCGPNYPGCDLTLHFLLSESPVFFHYHFLRVAQQVKRNVEFFNEILMRRPTVGGDTQNDRFEFLEFAIDVNLALFNFAVIRIRQINGGQGIVTRHAIFDCQNGGRCLCVLKKQGVVTHAQSQQNI